VVSQRSGEGLRSAAASPARSCSMAAAARRSGIVAHAEAPSLRSLPAWCNWYAPCEQDSPAGLAGKSAACHGELFACFAATIPFAVSFRMVDECWLTESCWSEPPQTVTRDLKLAANGRVIATDCGTPSWLSIAWLWQTVVLHAGGQQPDSSSPPTRGAQRAGPTNSARQPPARANQQRQRGPVARVLWAKVVNQPALSVQRSPRPDRRRH